MESALPGSARWRMMFARPEHPGRVPDGIVSVTVSSGGLVSRSMPNIRAADEVACADPRVQLIPGEPGRLPSRRGADA